MVGRFSWTRRREQFPLITPTGENTSSGMTEGLKVQPVVISWVIAGVFMPLGCEKWTEITH